MSDEARKIGPPTAEGPEKPIEGWKAISSEVELTIPTAWRMARRHIDPLPVWSYLHRVVAWRTALKEWASRQFVPVSRIVHMKALNGETLGTAENDTAVRAKNKARR